MAGNPNKVLLVVGGSGRTGRILIDEALRRGHQVIALVRNPATLARAPGLTILRGSPTVFEDLQQAVRASDVRPSAIISTLGQTRESGNPWSKPTSPPRYIAEAMSNCVAVAKEVGIPKLVVMTMQGAGSSFDSLSFLMRAIMHHSNMAQTLEDHNLVNEVVKKSGLAYVLARPAMLKGEFLQQYKDLGDDGRTASFMPSISAVTVASFLLDTVNTEEWDGRTPVISS
jgi:putative NADH-flavin reductase